MCGIAGILTDKPLEHRLDAMLSIQQHRGPDYTGKHISKNVFLGHNRLSIIDLSENANQPYYSNDGNLVIVFNGEIYNYLELKEELKYHYQFKTTSDTEVLLAAYQCWGVNCLQRLNGMFSFAIWDIEKQALFAVRDRFGVKPFHYFFDGNEFYFASEIKTLFAAGVPKISNNAVWANYFAFGSYGLPTETFWEGIEQLPGGHYLLFSNKQLNIIKWYHFENEVHKHPINQRFEDVMDTYEALLKDSIQLRFRADVPVGFNISGGLDSSTLLAYVNETQKINNINAYTFYCDDVRYDELVWVEEMIRLTNNPLKKVVLCASNIEALTSKMNQYQDEPYGGIPTIAYGELFKQAKADGVKVLLDGQGMDEQWAGYDYYTKNNDSIIQGVLSSPYKTNVLSKGFLELASKPKYPAPFNDRILNFQYRDLFYTKIPRALRFNDRLSMAHSTELREPFLDYRLVEFAFSQPLEYKIKDGTHKYLLRNLVSKRLSENLSFAPKRPLQTPQREWLGNELKDFVRSQLDTIQTSNYRQWFNKTALEKEWDNYLKGDNNSSFHIWQWVSVGMFVEL